MKTRRNKWPEYLHRATALRNRCGTKGDVWWHQCQARHTFLPMTENECRQCGMRLEQVRLVEVTHDP